jgi:hypothetical protein
MRWVGEAMRNDFFIEQYTRERHQAHPRETAEDRLLRQLRASGQAISRRGVYAQTAGLGTAVAAMTALARRRVAQVASN